MSEEVLTLTMSPVEVVDGFVVLLAVTKTLSPALIEKQLTKGQRHRVARPKQSPRHRLEHELDVVRSWMV